MDGGLPFGKTVNGTVYRGCIQVSQPLDDGPVTYSGSGSLTHKLWTAVGHLVCIDQSSQVGNEPSTNQWLVNHSQSYGGRLQTEYETEYERSPVFRPLMNRRRSVYSTLIEIAAT